MSSESAVSPLWNPFANMASLAGQTITMVRGEGCWVVDDQGRRYLDALASLWYCNVGHGRAELADAAAGQMRKLAAFQAFEYYSNPPADELARRVAGAGPGPRGQGVPHPGRRVGRGGYRGQAGPRLLAGGRPAGKQLCLSRTHAYHGMNAYGTSLGGIPANTDPFGPLVTGVERVRLG